MVVDSRGREVEVVVLVLVRCDLIQLAQCSVDEVRVLDDDRHFVKQLLKAHTRLLHAGTNGATTLIYVGLISLILLLQTYGAW